MDGIIEQEEMTINIFLEKHSTEYDGRFVRIEDRDEVETLIERKDAIILLRALMRQGLVTYEENGELSYCLRSVGVGTDEDTKKITGLTIGTLDDAEWKLHVDLIRPLKMLNFLVVENCDSIRTSQNSSLKQIKTLYMGCTYVDRDETTGTPFFRLLPNLEKLKIYDIREEEKATMINELRNNSDFRDTLKEIEFYDLSLNDTEKAAFLLDIPSEYKKLSYFTLYDCNIGSFKSIAGEIERRMANSIGNAWKPSKFIRQLDLNENPVEDKLKQDRDERNAMLKYLRLHSGIYSIEIDRNKQHPEIECQLKINHAGRKLLGGSSSMGKPPVTKALLATVLERSYNKSDHVWKRYERRNGKHDATGLYDLLRNGPFLQKKTRDKESTRSCQVD